MSALKRVVTRLGVSAVLAAGSVTAFSAIAATSAHAIPLGVCGSVHVSVEGISETVPVGCPGPCSIDQGPNNLDTDYVSVDTYECIVLP